ncbi:MAG: pinensin family lanthipeptide [Holophagales bacterium]|nr:pinensin family lanthipeptide [Holophagales bacterium]
MKKLKLDLDDLKVESFETTPETGEEAKGTVYGYITQDLTICDGCNDPTNQNTCASTCGSTCGNTCGSTCGTTCASTCGNTCGATCGCGGLTCQPDCNTNFACFICTQYC